MPEIREATDFDDEEGRMLDDIYDFELSEDQKLAVQELFNIKLDLGFAAGEKFLGRIAWLRPTVTNVARCVVMQCEFLCAGYTGELRKNG